MNQSRCKGCNKPIEWIEHHDPITATTKKIPLDPRAPTYEFDGSHWRKSSARVSHFATCPMADQFSSSNKPAQQSFPMEPRRLPYKEDE
jgi:hypothetical protein